MTIDPQRRSNLLQSRLRALAGAHWSVGADAVASGFPDGAALVDRDQDMAWVLVTGTDGVVRRLGGATGIAMRAGVSTLHVLVEDADAAPVLARRAGLLAAPPSVWLVTGTDIEPVEPAPVAQDVAPPPEAELYRPVLAEAGLTPVVEGGELLGELLGLEVARVVVDSDGDAHVEAGVGRFDREAGAMMFAELGETEALARAVQVVAANRRADLLDHPLHRLVPERWLRAVLIERPDLVGARELTPVGSAVPRSSLLEAGIASAVGTTLDGAPLVVTAGTGADLDLAVSAADDRLTHAPDARLVIVLPGRDALQIIGDLAGALVDPAEVVTVSADWRSAAATAGDL